MLSDRCRIFRVGDVLHPGGVVAVLRFLHRNVNHAGGRSAAMPMLFAGRNKDHIAALDLAYRLALGLDPPHAGDHVKRLAERMRVPRGSRARLERHAVGGQPCRRLRRDDRVLPDRAGKILLRREACRARASEMDIHEVTPYLGLVSLKDDVISSRQPGTPWSRHSRDRGRAAPLFTSTSRTTPSVAVVTRESVATASGVRDMQKSGSNRGN